MIALGLDPSLTAFGYAVLEAPLLVGGGNGPLRITRAGVWETTPDRAGKSLATDNNERFAYLTENLWAVAQQAQPTIIFTEGTIYMKKTTSTVLTALGRARGLVDMLTQVLKVPLVELSPQAVKSGLGIVRHPKGEGMATKAEVIARIVKLYPEVVDMMPTTQPGREAACDASAVAHVGIFQRAFRDRATSW